MAGRAGGPEGRSRVEIGLLREGEGISAIKSVHMALGGLSLVL